MPGSLSNEDEGQDDMDFGDDLPGEEGGRAVLHVILRRCALNAANRACPAIPTAQRRRRRVGCKKQSHAIILYLFLRHDRVFRWERAPGLDCGRGASSRP